MFKSIVFVVLFGIIKSGNSGSAPFIKKCKWDDSKCITETARAAIPIVAGGIPELGVQKLDPFFMKSLDASSPGLKLVLKDVTGTGLKDCVAKKVQRDISTSKLSVKLLCSVDFVAQYEMDGKLLVLPIQGTGKAHLVLRKVELLAVVELMDNIGKDGAKHWGIKNWTHSYSLKDKSTIELENLFNGNEVLGRAARELIATSSNEIMTEVGPPMIKGVASVIVDNIRNLLNNVPVEDLTL